MKLDREKKFQTPSSFLNFSYTHSPIKQNIGKLGVLLSIDTTKEKKDIIHLGKQLAMQVASLSPLSIDKEDLDKKIIQK